MFMGGGRENWKALPGHKPLPGGDRVLFCVCSWALGRPASQTFVCVWKWCMVARASLRRGG